MLTQSQTGQDSTASAQELETERRSAERDETLLGHSRWSLELLWLARGFIFKAAAAGAALSVVLALILPKTYQSTVRLIPPDKQSMTGASLLAGMMNNSAAAAARANALGLQSPDALYQAVLQSRTLQDYLIDRFDLRKEYHTPLYKDARLRLASHTDIAADLKSSVITVTVSAGSPQLAQGLATGYADELNSLMAQLNNSSARRERIFLEGRLKELAADLDKESTMLSEYSSKNTMIDVTEQGRAMLNAADLLQAQEIAAESDLEGLKQIYSPDNPRVLAGEARLASLQKELEKMRGTSATGGNDAKGGPSLRELPLLGVKYSDLVRNIKVEDAAFEALTNEYEMAKVQEAKDLPTVRVLDQADLPEHKSAPKRALIVVLGTLLAALLAGTYVIAGDRWSRQPPESAFKHFASMVMADVGSDMSHVPGLRRIGAVMARQSESDRAAGDGA
jgi:capsule polysaccharide export protein KpsE/RkpR